MIRIPRHGPFARTIGGRLRRGLPVVVAAFCAALLAICCGGGARTGADRAAADISVDSAAVWRGHRIRLVDPLPAEELCDTIRFGRLGSGEVACLPFLLENRTGRPAVISGYTRSCGCTTLEYDTRPIAPGAARRLSLRFDTRGERGWQLKQLLLRLEGQERPLRLLVEADVE